MTPTFSTIIPTYNRASYVGAAIESALGQEVGGGTEVIVVDDGSVDDTPAVVAAFGDRVTYLWQANQREGAARNLGAGQAAGQYLAFLDSDDFWRPGKLAADLERLEQPDWPAMVYSRAVNVGPDGGELNTRSLARPEGDVFWALARESFTPMSSVAVRTDAFRAVGGFTPDAALSGTADWELWLRLAARWPVGFAGTTATCIRVHPRNMLSDPDWMERAMLAGVRHALADEVVRRRVGRRAGFVWAQMYVTIALNAYANGRRCRGLAWLARAAGTWPPVASDGRFLGALVRLGLGPRMVSAVRALGPAHSSYPMAL